MAAGERHWELHRQLFGFGRVVSREHVVAG
jgi:hypothetical protein